MGHPFLIACATWLNQASVWSVLNRSHAFYLSLRRSIFDVTLMKNDPPAGAVAQLGERSVRNAEVEGSIPFRSTGLEMSPFCNPGDTVHLSWNAFRVQLSMESFGVCLSRSQGCFCRWDLGAVRLAWKLGHVATRMIPCTCRGMHSVYNCQWNHSVSAAVVVGVSAKVRRRRLFSLAPRLSFPSPCSAGWTVKPDLRLVSLV